ncbi:unnamed protein product [Prunus brigantina]
MSLRDVSRVVYQAGMRVMQGAWRFSSSVDSGAFKAANSDKVKQAEESLRTVMYLSCWGPN